MGGVSSSLLLCLKHDCLTNFQNTVGLSYVHTRSVRFLQEVEEGRGRGRSAVWEHNSRIRENGKNVGHNIFPNRRPNE